MSRLLVLPDDDTTVVARADGASLTELLRRGIIESNQFSPLEELHSRLRIQVHQDTWISRAMGPNTSFYCLRDGQLSPGCMAHLPALDTQAVAMRGSATYIGGTGTGKRGEREALYVSDREPVLGAQFRPVEVPDNLRWHDNKGIDALLVDGDTLIAIDNVVHPLYFLIYDVSDPHHPRLSRTVEFYSGGEQVLTAALGPCLAVLSCHHPRTKISLYHRASFAEIAYADLGTYEKPESMWRTIVFSGDRLYVAAGPEGVGVIDVPRVLREVQEEQALPWRRGEPFRPPMITLDYLPAPSGGPVRYVTEGDGGLYLHTPGHGGVRSEWLPL